MPTPLQAELLPVAKSYLSVRESPPGSNDGPEIRRFLAYVGVHVPAAWCSAWVCVVISEAAARVPIIPEFNKSASALHLLSANPTLVLTQEQALQSISEGIPVLAVFDHGGGLGHVGIAYSDHGVISLIAGNTNVDGSRNGVGVFTKHLDPKTVSGGWLTIA